jgi:hypothetical protein
VFVLVLILVLFAITAPSGDESRAFAVALAAAALTVAVLTSGARFGVRRRRALVVTAVGFVIVIGIATGAIGAAFTFVALTLIVVMIPVALANGLWRLISDEGVTLEVVAGALSIYLVVGLVFAFIVAFAARVETGHYFTQGAATTGDEIYYSFTVLTTTGFGDFTAANPFGHALAVLEMLTGQLYLVTVIGVIVGNFVGRRRRTAGSVDKNP